MKYHELIKDFLKESDRNSILDWIANNPFLDDDENQKKGFASTYKKDELPDWLNSFKDEKYNIYNFIGFFTFVGGFIEPHTDHDLFSYVKRKIDPSFIIGFPETIVYYADVCENMVGGNLIVDDKEITPVTNSAVYLEKNKVHSVTEVKSFDRERIVLVCEKYFLIESYYNKLVTPIHRYG